MRWRAALLGSALLGPGLWAASAGAHGINGHVHVTGWAAEAQPAGTALAALFADPVLKNAVLIAAAFPDSGYAVDHPYGEAAHWEPFTEAHVAYVRDTFGPDYASVEAQQQVAFLIGTACHGLQDELFDSLFLLQVREKDGRGQDEADPGTDAFLQVDGHLRYYPEVWLPAAALVQVFQARGIEVSEGTMERGMRLVSSVVINGREHTAPVHDAEYRPLLPWASQHYVDYTVPGSIAAEIPATAAYQRALWARLHGEFPVSELVVHGWPGARRLRSVRADTVDSWISLVFGAGVTKGSLNAETVRLLDPAGQAVPATVHGTRWGGSPTDSSRLVTLRPTVDLLPDTPYTVRLEPGVTLIDGTVLEVPWETTFQTPCADPEAAGCVDEPPPAFPPPPPPDAAVPEDMGVADLGAVDLGSTDPGEDLGAGDMAGPAILDGAVAADLAGAAATPGAGDEGGCSSTGGRGPWPWLALLLGALSGPRRRRARGAPGRPG